MAAAAAHPAAVQLLLLLLAAACRCARLSRPAATAAGLVRLVQQLQLAAAGQAAAVLLLLQVQVRHSMAHKASGLLPAAWLATS
jgi:hypothetical protein